MTTTSHYRRVWESYWGSLTGAPDEIFWDVPPEQAAALDLASLKDHANPDLPLVDVGCGNGTQTRFLAQYFSTVIGTEISPRALAIAAEHEHPRISYRLLDILDADAVADLYAELGDANVYVRTVLHQFDPADHSAAAAGIAKLIGDTGVAIMIELSSAAEDFYADLIARHGMPPALARIFQHGITPGLLNENNFDALFPRERFTTLAAGETVIHTCHTLPNGEQVRVPAFWITLRRRHGQQPT